MLRHDCKEIDWGCSSDIEEQENGVFCQEKSLLLIWLQLLLTSTITVPAFIENIIQNSFTNLAPKKPSISGPGRGAK